MSDLGHCANVHRNLFPTYDELLGECCAKEERLIAQEKRIERIQAARRAAVQFSWKERGLARAAEKELALLKERLAEMSAGWNRVVSLSLVKGPMNCAIQACANELDAALNGGV